MDIQALERLAAIEAVTLRTEKKIDKHIDAIEKRISRLEHVFAWASGAVAVALLWIKTKLNID